MSAIISVIVPVYNAQAYLRQCMDSLVNQTLKDIEIICVDDGSTDSSPEILAEYAARDSRIRVIRQENGGTGAARNNGLGYATGEYLSILDCDDFFELDMLEKSYAAAKKDDLDIIVFGCDIFLEDVQQYEPCTFSITRPLLPDKPVFNVWDIPQDVLQLFRGWAWDKLFRRSFVEEHQLFFQEQRTTNDALFVFSGILLAQRMGVLDIPLAHHRRYSGSLSATREKSWMCFYNALMALREKMKEMGCYRRFERDYKNYCLNFTLWNLRTLSEPAHTLLYNKLKEEWFAEMGLLEHPAEYFYRPPEYRDLRRIMEHPADWKPAPLPQPEKPATLPQPEKPTILSQPEKPATLPQPRKVSLWKKFTDTLKYYGGWYTLRKVVNKLLFLITGKEDLI